MAPKSIFINLPVTDIKASTKFYEAVGAKLNTDFCDAETSCMVFSETVSVMIMTFDRFKFFCPKDKEIAISKASTESNTAKPVSEVLLCLSVESRAEVDDIVERASKAGGKIDPNTVPSNEVMYGRSFEDLDGHVWELVYMDLAAMAACRPDTTADKTDAAAGVV